MIYSRLDCEVKIIVNISNNTLNTYIVIVSNCIPVLSQHDMQSLSKPLYLITASLLTIIEGKIRTSCNDPIIYLFIAKW